MDQTLQSAGSPTGSARVLLIITVILCTLIELIDATIINVAIPEISGSIGATATEIAWVVTIYAIANAIVLPLSGMLSDLFGRRNYFTGSVVIFTIGSLMCGLSTSLWELILWRFIQGVAGGGLAAIAGSIVIGAFPPEKINTANAIFGSGLIIGPIIGPLFGGLIVQHLSWHWIFFVNVPLGIIGCFMSWLFVTNLAHSKRPEKIDWWGILFLSIGIGSLLYFFEEGGRDDWFNSTTITLVFITTILGLTAFIWRELSTAHPAVNIRILRHYNLLMGCIFTVLMGCIMMAGMFIFPLFVRSAYGWTPIKTGVFLMCMGIALILGMAPARKLIENGLKPKYSMVIGAGVVVFSMIMMSFSGPDSHESNFLLPLMIQGLGMPFLLLPILQLSFRGYQGSELQQAAGLRNMFKKIGGAIGLPIVTTYLNHQNANAAVALGQYSDFSDPQVIQRVEGLKQLFISAGYATDDALNAAYQMLGNLFLKQQILISYTHTYLMMGILVIVFCLPVILLLKSKKPTALK